MESLEKHVHALSVIIEKEYEQYKRVFDLVRQEQKILVNADIDALEGNLREQQEIIRTINKLEAKRLREIEVIGVYLGVVPEKLKISNIAQNTPGELSRNLTDIERKFKSVLQEILKINKSNKFLINSSLQFIDKNIQVFFGTVEDKGLYSPENAAAKAPSKTNYLVDRKA